MMVQELGLSIRQACQAARLARSAFYVPPRPRETWARMFSRSPVGLLANRAEPPDPEAEYLRISVLPQFSTKVWASVQRWKAAMRIRRALCVLVVSPGERRSNEHGKCHR